MTSSHAWIIWRFVHDATRLIGTVSVGQLSAYATVNQQGSSGTPRW